LDAWSIIAYYNSIVNGLLFVRVRCVVKFFNSFILNPLVCNIIIICFLEACSEYVWLCLYLE
jgi:hypothetical protein